MEQIPRPATSPKTRDIRAKVAGTNARYIDLADKLVKEHPELARRATYAPLPDRPEWIAHELERRADARDVPCPQAAAEWIEHARHRLRRELGEDVPGAVVPVRLALRSALTCLQV